VFTLNKENNMFEHMYDEILIKADAERKARSHDIQGQHVFVDTQGNEHRVGIHAIPHDREYSYARKHHLYCTQLTNGPDLDRTLAHDSSPEVTERETNVNATVGRFYRMKYRDFTSNGSYYEAAKNLRKQGVPVGIALLILTGRA